MVQDLVWQPNVEAAAFNTVTETYYQNKIHYGEPNHIHNYSTVISLASTENI
jgi:hypothetical protein